ncbi:DISARM system phospholipase D-like protein DrmC [Frankia gtarii]|uniref:DISARM system phospholipase D-like protein DrmC n=1 Tax=Frankia gtarii TaxID=2950102 RepID=UPI0021C1CA75|nr:DISARM system phospholipase D-like protein DrmC [Frankia gtarii]
MTTPAGVDPDGGEAGGAGGPSPDDFAAAVAVAVDELGPQRLRDVAARIALAASPDGRTIPDGPTTPDGPTSSDWEYAVLAAVPGGARRAAVRQLLTARRGQGIAPAEAAAYLRGVADGYLRQAMATRVESVWSGPGSHEVPVRATARVLVDLVAGAIGELLLMTYSARSYPPLLRALAAALGRGVAVSVVVETLQGAGGALNGAEPAVAFADLPDVDLWHWPTRRRAHPSARMHAKIAVADRRALLVSSANLTSSGVEENIEAGLLVRGGTPPRRAAEHITALMTSGMLTRLRPGVPG